LSRSARKEQRAAAKVLGVKKVEFLGYKDGHLAPNLKLRHDIVRMIRKYKPDLVITHLPGRAIDAPMGAISPDHLAVVRPRWQPFTRIRATRALSEVC